MRLCINLLSGEGIQVAVQPPADCIDTDGVVSMPYETTPAAADMLRNIFTGSIPKPAKALELAPTLGANLIKNLDYACDMLVGGDAQLDAALSLVDIDSVDVTALTVVLDELGATSPGAQGVRISSSSHIGIRWLANAQADANCREAGGELWEKLFPPFGEDLEEPLTDYDVTVALALAAAWPDFNFVSLQRARRLWPGAPPPGELMKRLKKMVPSWKLNALVHGALSGLDPAICGGFALAVLMGNEDAEDIDVFTTYSEVTCPQSIVEMLAQASNAPYDAVFGDGGFRVYKPLPGHAALTRCFKKSMKMGAGFRVSAVYGATPGGRVVNIVARHDNRVTQIVGSVSKEEVREMDGTLQAAISKFDLDYIQIGIKVHTDADKGYGSRLTGVPLQADFTSNGHIGCAFEAIGTVACFSALRHQSITRILCRNPREDRVAKAKLKGFEVADEVADLIIKVNNASTPKFPTSEKWVGGKQTTTAIIEEERDELVTRIEMAWGAEDAGGKVVTSFSALVELLSQKPFHEARPFHDPYDEMSLTIFRTGHFEEPTV